MAFLDVFRNAPVTPVVGNPNTGVSGVFTPSTLPLAVFHDIDSSLLPVSESEVFAVPAAARALGLYTSLISRMPLKGAPFITRHDGGVVTPGVLISNLVQDVILYNASVLAIAERDEAGYPAKVVHISRSRWSVTDNGRLQIDGKVVADDSFIYIQGLMRNGGLTVAAKDSIRQYTSIASTISARIATPNPAIVVGADADYGESDDEINDLITNLQNALTSKRGGIIYRPAGLTIDSFGASDSATEVMVPAREAVRKDIANFLQVNVSLLDGSGGASDVYTNALQAQSELLELSIRAFADPIVDRLNQTDVTPEGIRVSFDYSAFDSIADAAGNLGAPRALNPMNSENTNE